MCVKSAINAILIKKNNRLTALKKYKNSSNPFSRTAAMVRNTIMGAENKGLEIDI